MLLAIIITLIIVIPLSIIWVRGIDYMKENHPNYKGEDLFNELDKEIDSNIDINIKAAAGRDGWDTIHWDDNDVHTEQNF
jgi:hypothetical protein